MKAEEKEDDPLVLFSINVPKSCKDAYDKEAARRQFKEEDMEAKPSVLGRDVLIEAAKKFPKVK